MAEHTKGTETPPSDGQDGGTQGSPEPAPARGPAAQRNPVQRITGFFDSTTKVLLAIGGLIAAITGLVSLVVHLLTATQAGRAPAPATHAGSIPASATPQYVIRPESCGALSYGADGNAGPVTCPDGRPNLAADQYYRAAHLKVLSLGPDATPGDVYKAICLGMSHSTIPIETSAVELAQAEQGWHFGINPAADMIGTVASCAKSPS